MSYDDVRKKERKMKHPYLIAFGVFALVLLLTACGGTSQSSTGRTSGATVQVTETDFHINASTTSFSPGITYRFVFTKTWRTAHEFMIMPRSEGSMGNMPMGDMDKMALASISNLNPGETKTLDYTFPSSATSSHPELACYLPGHYEAGMKQEAAVTA